MFWRRGCARAGAARRDACAARAMGRCGAKRVRAEPREGGGRRVTVSKRFCRPEPSGLTCWRSCVPRGCPCRHTACVALVARAPALAPNCSRAHIASRAAPCTVPRCARWPPSPALCASSPPVARAPVSPVSRACPRACTVPPRPRCARHLFSRPCARIARTKPSVLCSGASFMHKTDALVRLIGLLADAQTPLHFYPTSELGKCKVAVSSGPA